MGSNILKAIKNIKKYNKFDLNLIYPIKSKISTENRIQTVGKGLEIFVKDSFSNSFDKLNKLDIYKNYFSYFGNANNPPDSMLINSDAIEVKKISSHKSEIQLNSSFPKSKLYCHDPLINTACRTCEKWSEKDMLYTFGIFDSKNKTKLKSLAFIYGNCFAADEEIYLNVKNKITSVIKNIPDSESTNEIGRINKVDPLGITKLRVRGMWIIKNPYRIFDNLFKYEQNKHNFTLFALMTKNKFNSFPEEDKKDIIHDKTIIYEEIIIPNPNNPVKIIEGVMLRYDSDE